MAICPKTLLSAVLFGLASATVLPRAFTVPAINGFPNPTIQQQGVIAQQALGKLPNGPFPTTLKDGSATALQLIVFNELFETAYFTSLLANITSKAPGYESGSNAQAIGAITAVQAQEQQHALGAIALLKGAVRFAPQPCKYTFPVSDFANAINLAETFTAVVLGALQGANVAFAKDGVPNLVQLISSVIGQEGEQNGYYRIVLNRVPSSSPFLTPVPAAFAFSALQMFVVPGSCPFPLSNIDLPILPGIMTNGDPVGLVKPGDQTVRFSADLTGSEAAGPYVGKSAGLFMTYTTGQQVPVSVPVFGVRWTGRVISFLANFPYQQNVAAGFSHGALTTGNRFATADAVAEGALAGPAIIQVNNIVTQQQQLQQPLPQSQPQLQPQPQPQPQPQQQ